MPDATAQTAWATETWAKPFLRPPRLLAYMITRPIAVDEYLVWSISEGGKQFGSAMPTFKDNLSREEIWQIIAYMRAGFPAMQRDPGAK